MVLWIISTIFAFNYEVTKTNQTMDSKILENKFYVEVLALLTAFLNTKDKAGEVALIKGLKRVEVSLRKLAGRGSKERGLWLRFFNNDTGATSIANIEIIFDVTQTTKRNYGYMVECMEIAVTPESGMQIHFS